MMDDFAGGAEFALLNPVWTNFATVYNLYVFPPFTLSFGQNNFALLLDEA